ncbi:MAG: hypothetical protein RLZZ156_1546 [Deinococcota bacterium]|jgi:threonine dehydrogenase-like Zn-dependent dehydrogenase
MDSRDLVATLCLTAPYQLEWRLSQAPALQPNQVRLRTLFSGISAGTELTQYRGTNPLLEKHFDPEHRLFFPTQTKAAYPLEGWGYEQVGQIIELGAAVQGLTLGSRVWGSWGHRSSVVLPEDMVRGRILPDQTLAHHGIFARIGAIALNPVHDAEIRLGDWVAVFGLGVIGLLIVQLCKASGAKVIAVDKLESRLAQAKRFGADVVFSDHAAEKIKRLTGFGADVCIEASGSYDALHQAIRAVAYNAKVITAGFMQGQAVGLALGEEFHHNRVQLICSQTSGVSPSLDHRWNRLRLEQTIMQQKLDFESLITHRFWYQEAARAFELLDQNQAQALQVVLEFP